MHSRHRDDDDEQLDEQPTKFVDIAKKWPKQTFLIIGNELCERFSFYGMRAVLTLYFVNVLHFKNAHATVFFHAFTVVSYSSPILGSILADGYIGKFWTIFSVSILYAIGQILLASASIAPDDNPIHPWLDMLGLLIIGIGTGGIKPCVSAFGGDQFPAHYTKMISYFFSMFYFSINAGSLISMYLTPYLRSVPCFGNDSCYPMAFGVPAILMILATLIFMAGSFWYKKVPPKENVISRVMATISRALKNKSSGIPRSHWIEHSLDGHVCSKSKVCRELHGKCAERKFVEDVKVLFRVCLMMLPVPMFWALYDQQGSTWVIQAISMDAHITDSWTLIPDQMGFLNAFMILLMIPIFQSGIYPFVEKIGIKLTLLRKMTAGGLLTATAFIICGIVQLFVNRDLPILPSADEAHMTIINTFPTCEFHTEINTVDSFLLPANQTKLKDVIEPAIIKGGIEFTANITFDSDAPNCPKFVANPVLYSGYSYYLALSPIGWAYTATPLKKPSNGQGEFAISLNYMVSCDNIPDAVTWKECNSSTSTYNGVIGLCKVDELTRPEAPCDPKSDGRFYQFSPSRRHQLEVHDYQTGEITNTGATYDAIDVRPGTYRLYYIDYEIDYVHNARPSAEQTRFYPLDLPPITQNHMGGVYTLTIATRSKLDVVSYSQIMVPYNKVSIIWQIPQYIVLTAGEVLFSVTGLEFAYSEASPQLKSVVQAVWLFTVAVGDLIDVVILSLNLFSDVATQMFVFGAAMYIVMAIFILLAVNYYEYAHYANDDSEAANAIVDTDKIQ
ncbi:unnamed protein product [Caenorhabditis bovis]|uniref:Oligopeptide transporter 1 n=1 Tax=Caenorhabditis bovis TaxID=2654633 RepID=A0A8S1F9L6_9PELO|nr:unnamed protein product [Caenorhabditis bovis]